MRIRKARVNLVPKAIDLEESLCNILSPRVVLGLPVDLAPNECS